MWLRLLVNFQTWYKVTSPRCWGGESKNQAQVQQPHWPSDLSGECVWVPAFRSGQSCSPVFSELPLGLCAVTGKEVRTRRIRWLGFEPSLSEVHFKNERKLTFPATERHKVSQWLPADCDILYIFYAVYCLKSVIDKADGEIKCRRTQGHRLQRRAPRLSPLWLREGRQLTHRPGRVERWRGGGGGGGGGGGRGCSKWC